MLATVENSLEKMRQLMLQLREGEAPAGRPQRRRPGADRAADRGRRRRTRPDDRGGDRLTAVLHAATRSASSACIGHVVQNALDATPDRRQGLAQLRRDSGQAQVEIGDTGTACRRNSFGPRCSSRFRRPRNRAWASAPTRATSTCGSSAARIDVDSELGRGHRHDDLLAVYSRRTRRRPCKWRARSDRPKSSRRC